MRTPITTLVLVFTLCFAAQAQTYTPKRIEIEGPIDLDRAAALSVLALKTPAPVTKDDIEAALGRLADTGLYTDISYKVDSNVLTITLTPSAASMVKPVIFANFVWWQPGELGPLVEARVPNYTGKLPPVGPLTDKVKSALIALLSEKGVSDASIEARIGKGTILSITHPEVLIDKVVINGSLPALQRQVDFDMHHLHGEEYDQSEARESIVGSLQDTYRDAGYLDATATDPAYSAPHKDLAAYAVDLTATVTPGERYHVSAVAFHAAPPITQAALADAVNLKAGDIASGKARNDTITAIAQRYREQGYWAVNVNCAVTKDAAAHTAAYDIGIEPGVIYHFAALDLTALAADQQSAFAAAFHLQAGAPADKGLQTALARAGQVVGKIFVYEYVPNNDAETITVKVKLPKS